MTVSPRRAMSPCRRRRSRARTPPPSRSISIRSSSSGAGCPCDRFCDAPVQHAGRHSRGPAPFIALGDHPGQHPRWRATVRSAYGLLVGASTSPAGATAPHLAAQRVGVTAARPAENIEDGSNCMLTSPNWGPICVIDHQGIETGSRNVENYSALLTLIRSDCSPKRAAGALEALLSDA